MYRTTNLLLNYHGKDKLIEEWGELLNSHLTHKKDIQMIRKHRKGYSVSLAIRKIT